MLLPWVRFVLLFKILVLYKNSLYGIMPGPGQLEKECLLPHLLLCQRSDQTKPGCQGRNTQNLTETPTTGLPKILWGLR